MISDSLRFTQKTSTCELCPSPLCPSVYQKQLATGQKLGLTYMWKCLSVDNKYQLLINGLSSVLCQVKVCAKIRSQTLYIINLLHILLNQRNKHKIGQQKYMTMKIYIENKYGDPWGFRGSKHFM